MGRTVGIDLGTTNSVVAVMQGGEPVVIPNSEGGRTTPSVVAFTASGERLVGAPAKRQAAINPENTIYSIKRFMGRRFDEVAEERKLVPYEVVEGRNGMAVVEIQGKQYAPEEISAMILQKLKADAEAYLGETVTAAVVTVPAYFNDAQRTATKNAGQIAGLEVLRIINEPTAASLAYGLDKKSEETILVYDLGGGTFDISILDVSEGLVEVRATNGDTHLGGDDWDQRIVDFLAESFQRSHGTDLRKDPQALQRLRDEAEKGKINLSSAVTTSINIPYVTMDASGPKHLAENLTRARFEELTRNLLERTERPFEAALKDAGITSSKLDEIVLVGGSTRMPMVLELVKRLGGGKDPHRGVNPDEVVAVGAAVQGGVLSKEVKDILLLDVTPLTLGLETLGGITDKLIERNTTIPTRQTRTYTTAADGQNQVEIHILQGEREMARDNKTLGRFTLAGIPPAPRGIPQIEVTFDIDPNGILSVSARDKTTGKEQSVTITGSTNLDKSDIDRMIREAQVHAQEDAQRREEADVHNRAEQKIYSAEQTLKDLSDKLPGDVKNGVQTAVANLREALEGGADVERIKSRIDALEQATYRMSEVAYQSSAAGDPGSGGGAAGGGPRGSADPDDEVIDADFKTE
ncbi:MAG: molecular chaperone DnaK [Armatimonadetes bacterium]|nr:molecular chaperone DnaK [Armatimonadota bacterium]